MSAASPVIGTGFEKSHNRQQFLTFELENELYGVNILCVQEIKGWTGVRDMPDMPGYVVGVMDLRGIIVPVMDLRLRFGIEAKPYSEKTVVIIVATKLEDEIIPLGLVVDAVSDVMEINGNDLKPAPKVSVEKRDRYIQGLVSTDREMMVVLNIEKLLGEKLLNHVE